MFNDAIVVATTEDECVKTVKDVVDEALKLHRQFRRDSDLSALAKSNLADSTLVQDCLLISESHITETRGHGVQGILHWVIDKLSPGGAHNFIERPWRLYNCLYYPYLAQQVYTFEKLAEKMALGEGAVYSAREQALHVIASRLCQELANPQEIESRKQYIIEHRYRALWPDEQKLLHLAAIFRKPLPPHALQQLANTVGIAEPTATIRKLIGNWLVQHGDEI